MLVKSIFRLILKSSINQGKCTNPLVKRPVLYPKILFSNGHKKKQVKLAFFAGNRVIPTYVVALATSQFHFFTSRFLSTAHTSFPSPPFHRFASEFLYMAWWEKIYRSLRLNRYPQIIQQRHCQAIA